MGKLDNMLSVFEKMDNNEQKLVYKILAIFAAGFILFAVFGIVHLNTCIL